MNTRKSRARILVIRKPLIAAVSEADGVESISEDVIEDYKYLRDKCELILDRIKRRKGKQ